MGFASFRGGAASTRRSRFYFYPVPQYALLAILALDLPAHAKQPAVQIPLTLAKGSPLRITLVKRVPIKNVGVPVEGRLTDPLYVYDHDVLPAGSEVLGHVTQVKGASRMTRAQAIMNGNFTPLRAAQVEFDTLVLKSGKRIPISTLVMPGAAPAIQLVSGGKKKGKSKDPASGVIAAERQQIEARKNAVAAAIRAPDKLGRLKTELKKVLAAESPYHRQAFQPGDVFTAELQAPLHLGMEVLPASALTEVGSPPPPDCVIHALLLTPLNSATARRGAPVEAVVTEPLFSAKHQLIIPQGSRLTGTVVQAKAARRLHRNGKLRFTFQSLQPPTERPEAIHASVQRVEVARSSHLKLDAEGGAAPAPSKKKYIAPAISVLLAMQAATPDRDAFRHGALSTAAPSQGGTVGQVLSGGWGLGLVGSALALAVHSRVLTASLGFYGAALSIYSNLLTRGQNVVFPANTPMEIRLGSHEQPASKLPAPAIPHG